MCFVFGGATTDYVSWATDRAPGGANPVPLVMGWFKPTTLTATRGYLSFGTIFGIEVDSTTSELRLRTDNTTDGQWTTSGAGIVVDVWHFIAVLFTASNTGPTAAWRVWIGTATSPPREVTVTNVVAPVGNFVGSSSFFVGNKGAGSLAFQGLVDWVFAFNTVIPTGNATIHTLNIATLGAIANAEAEFVLQRYVRPAWVGDLVLMRGQLVRLNAGNTFYNDCQFWSGLGTFVHQVTFEAAAAAASTSGGRYATINGATPSQERGPVPASAVRLMAA